MCGLEMMIMTYVFVVNWSMKAVNCLFCTSIDMNCAWLLLQLNLNCLMMLLI